MSDEEKRVVAYVCTPKGLSDPNQLPGLSDQKTIIQNFCSENRMVIDHTIMVDDRARFDPSDRFAEAIRIEQNSNIRGFVVANTKLITEDINTYFYYKLLLRKENMELWSAIEDFGIETGIAPILDAFTNLVADKEKHNLLARTSTGRNVKAKLGGYSGGHAPYGYVVQNRRLVVDQEQADVVREIFDLRRKGGTYKGIAAQLNKEGKKSRSGKPFSFSTVRIILDNKKTYEGYYHYKGLDNKETWVRGQQEPILKDLKD